MKRRGFCSFIIKSANDPSSSAVSCVVYSRGWAGVSLKGTSTTWDLFNIDASKIFIPRRKRH